MNGKVYNITKRVHEVAKKEGFEEFIDRDYYFVRKLKENNYFNLFLIDDVFNKNIVHTGICLRITEEHLLEVFKKNPNINKSDDLDTLIEKLGVEYILDDLSAYIGSACEEDYLLEEDCVYYDYESMIKEICLDYWKGHTPCQYIDEEL